MTAPELIEISLPRQGVRWRLALDLPKAATTIVNTLLDEEPLAEAPVYEASLHRPQRSRVWVATFTGPMNDSTLQEAPEAKPLFDADQFVRESPVWRQMKYNALKANLRRVANDQGFEIVAIEHINSSVVRLTAYVGNEDEQRTSLRCRSMICGLLRSAGVSVRKNKVFARYRRSVIRCVLAPDWD